MKSATVACLLLFSVSLSFSQPPDTLWTRHFSPLWPDAGGLRSVHALPDGGFLAVGHCCYNLYHFFYNAAYIGRYDSEGNAIWENHYWGTSGSTLGIGAIAFDVWPLTESGCIVAAGIGTGWPWLPATVMRVNEGGTIEWAFSSTTYGLTEMRAVSMTTENVVAAVASDSGTVFRFSLDGDTLSRTDLYPADLFATLPTPDGGFVVAGSDTFPIRYAFYLAKFDAHGDTMWTRRHSVSTLGGGAYALCHAPNGGFMLAGTALMPDTTLPEFAAVVMVDSNGQFLNQRIYGDIPPVIAADRCAEGGYILLADRLLRINDEGDTLWTRTLPCNDCFYSVIQTADSGYLVAGQITVDLRQKAYLAKYTREGLPVTDHSTVMPIEFQLTAFPNPFNPTTTISFSLPKSTITRLTVFNLLGREVAVLTDGMLEAGEHRFSFDGSDLPSGLYFARLNSGEFAATRKLLLVK
ncbi:MAG: T9SS type A sorting domain-containing protein [Calditrichota bacterium]